MLRTVFRKGQILCLGFVLVMCEVGSAGVAVRRTAVQARVEVNKELAHVLSVVEVKANPDLAIEPAPGTTNPLQVFTRDRKYSAYVLCVPLVNKEDPKRCAQRVHFDDYTGAAKIFQIRGEEELEEVTRPVDNLKWVRAFTLSYERWTGPHFGHRYVIDVRTKKQLAAYDLFG